MVLLLLNGRNGWTNSSRRARSSNELNWIFEVFGRIFEEVEARVYSLITLLFPGAIQIELATLICNWIVFLKMLKRHDHIPIYFACHLRELFVQACVHRVDIKRARVPVQRIIVLLEQEYVTILIVSITIIACCTKLVDF